MVKVSVIMGVYNCKDKKMLKKSIDSIINQTYSNWEYIICNDGSTDNTLEELNKIVQVDSRIKVISYDKNKGLNYALNMCLKEAKGTSMLEDYTYNLVPGKEGILEAHMLEICPSIAEGPIQIKCQPLSMGDREDPARLVFTSKEGTGIATSLVDLGDRFRLIINTVDCKKTEKPMPKLPVATNFWTPQPDLYTGAEAWILAGGAHHTAFTYDLTAEQMGEWAAMMGIEAVFIDNDTTIRNFKKDLMLGNIFYK